MRALALLTLLASSNAFADVAIDRDTVAKHLRDGRRRSARGEWAAAAKEFEEARKLAPKDPKILLELGWVAFRAGDNARARTVDAELLALAPDDDTKAKVLYNEGRIDEREGDRAKAADHYKQSLALRENATVRARSDAVSGAPPTKRTDCTHPATPEALCDCLADERFAKEASGSESRGDFDCIVGERVDGPPPVAVLATTWNNGDAHYAVTIRSGDGWRRVDGFDAETESQHTAFSVERLAVRAVGGRRVLWLESSETTWNHGNTPEGDGYIEADTDNNMYLCVLDGPSAPSCTAAIPLDRDCHGRVAAYRVDLAPDGTATARAANKAAKKCGAPPRPVHLW